MNDNCIDFFELSVNELLILNLLLTISLANQLNGNQLNILGNFICSLGQNMLTMQAVIGALPEETLYTVCTNPSYKTPQTNACPKHANSKDIDMEIQALKEKLHALEEILSPHKRQNHPNNNTYAYADQRDRQGNE